MFSDIQHLKQHFYKELANLYSQKERSQLFYALMENMLKTDKSKLLANPKIFISPYRQQKIAQAIMQLKLEKPIEYILKTCQFGTIPLIVNPNVLIPRPETEELVNIAVRYIGNQQKKIIDIGTGSGCIAISLKKILPKLNVTAIDFDKKALYVAKKNAIKNKTLVKFRQLDILNSKTSFKQGHFDYIISNPPYVGNDEAVHMKNNVLKYEPKHAIFVSNNDVLLFYKKIAQFSLKYLAKEGTVFLEINENHGKDTAMIYQNSGFSDVKLQKDFSGKDRFIIAKR